MMQYELTTYALRTPGQESLARWQYERRLSCSTFAILTKPLPQNQRSRRSAVHHRGAPSIRGLPRDADPASRT